MIPAHEICPICKNEFRHSKYINKQCQILSKKMSFVESVCNQPDVMSDNKPYPIHLFFQISSLYGELLFQKVQLITHNFEVYVNYPLHKSGILIFPRADIHCVTASIQQPTAPIKLDPIIFENRLLEFDFPNLEKIIDKANTCKMFL